MADTYVGHSVFTPTIVEDEVSGRDVEVYVTADAVSYEARVGVKAGNRCIDKTNKSMQDSEVVERQKKLFRIQLRKEMEWQERKEPELMPVSASN